MGYPEGQVGMAGIEPAFLRPKRSVMPFYYIP